MDQQVIKDVSLLLSNKCLLQGSSCPYDGKYLKLDLDAAEVKTLSDVGIFYDIEDTQLDISKVFDNTFYIYYNIQDFLKRFKSPPNLTDVDILILKGEGSYLLKLKNSTGNTLISKYDNYKRILNFFLNATDFISYKSSASQEFVLISEKGPIQIGYNPLEERVLNLDNQDKILERLEDSFKNIEFQGFFSNAIIETIRRFPKQDRFYQIISALSILLDIADRDYQLYIRKFAFDKIKSKFKEERLKYFESIEKNIDSINKQVTAFPLTFSASAFASYQVKDKPFILLLILLVYILYTIIAWKIINLSNSNMNNVYRDMVTEAKSIIRVYDVIYKEFKPDFKKILTRIKHVNSLIRILKISFVVMLALFIIFVLAQIFSATPTIETTKFKFI